MVHAPLPTLLQLIAPVARTAQMFVGEPEREVAGGGDQADPVP